MLQSCPVVVYVLGPAVRQHHKLLQIFAFHCLCIIWWGAPESGMSGDCDRSWRRDKKKILSRQTSWASVSTDYQHFIVSSTDQYPAVCEKGTGLDYTRFGCGTQRVDIPWLLVELMIFWFSDLILQLIESESHYTFLTKLDSTHRHWRPAGQFWLDISRFWRDEMSVLPSLASSKYEAVMRGTQIDGLIFLRGG